MAMGIYPFFTPIQEVYGNKVRVDGKEMIMVGSNNYLGLLDHPQVKEAAKEAVDKYGVATCGSRFLNGTLDIHVELEKKLAQFMNKEAALQYRFPNKSRYHFYAHRQRGCYHHGPNDPC